MAYPSPSDPNIPVIYGPYLMGTPTVLFDLNMALIPGMAASTRIEQCRRALTYWQNLQSSGYVTDVSWHPVNVAVAWIQAEISRVENPPANSLSVTYPV